MRIKYNTIFSNSYITEMSYIRKYLGDELETVLNPEANSIHDVDFDSIYVNVPEFEAKLNPLKTKSDSDRCVFLTGLTGCGKSSLLNHTFHHIERKIHIENNSLYIPFSFDQAIVPHEKKEEIVTYFVNVISAACEIIQKNLMRREKK